MEQEIKHVIWTLVNKSVKWLIEMINILIRDKKVFEIGNFCDGDQDGKFNFEIKLFNN